jgi:hypothetical protein
MATDRLENPKTNAIMRGKIVESDGKRSGKVAFLSGSGKIVRELGRVVNEATGLSMEMAEIPQVQKNVNIIKIIFLWLQFF